LGLKLAKVLEDVNKGFRGILSETIYCVATMLQARYTDRYFDTFQGLREMLQTQLDKMDMGTVTVRTEEEATDRELKLHCLTCMMKSWLRLKRQQRNSTTSK
jgi:hypothetical protein